MFLKRLHDSSLLLAICREVVEQELVVMELVEQEVAVLIELDIFVERVEVLFSLFEKRKTLCLGTLHL